MRAVEVPVAAGPDAGRSIFCFFHVASVGVALYSLSGEGSAFLSFVKTMDTAVQTWYILG